MRYYCDDTFRKDDDIKWNHLLDYAFDLADHVEFNILHVGQKYPSEIESLLGDLVERKHKRDKIYATDESIRFKLTDSLKNFIKSKKYNDWNNYFLEDISFIKHNLEFMATITHENYIILQMTEDLRDDLNNKNFDFCFDWGAIPNNKFQKDKKTKRN
ncbi:MAG: hypothetical protein MUF43_14700 [Flavobacterium sp.]|jgi:hypothetical protein|nr:hypothetical protein [Flavobacterium sp.]